MTEHVGCERYGRTQYEKKSSKIRFVCIYLIDTEHLDSRKRALFLAGAVCTQ